MHVVDCLGFNSALDVDVGWVEALRNPTYIRMLGCAPLHPTYNFLQLKLSGSNYYLLPMLNINGDLFELNVAQPIHA
ncbi:MAG: hypothetical protein V7K62_17940 [Nostoc sp.]